MPTYEYRCSGCGKVVEVQRSFDDYKVPPTADEGRHEECPGLSFKRILTRPSRIFVHESEDVYWRDV